MNIYKLKNRYVLQLSFEEIKKLRDVINQSYAELGVEETERFADYLTKCLDITDKHGGYNEPAKIKESDGEVPQG